MRWRRLLLSLAAVALLGVTGFFLYLWLTPPDYSLQPIEESYLARIQSSLAHIPRWLNSPATYLYHEERPYFTLAIAVGVLALLLWLYQRSCRPYWSPLLTLGVVLLGLVGFALFFWLSIPAPTSDTADYHEGRSYFAFAIVAGVLALLLLLYASVHLHLRRK